MLAGKVVAHIANLQDIRAVSGLYSDTLHWQNAKTCGRVSMVMARIFFCTLKNRLIKDTHYATINLRGFHKSLNVAGDRPYAAVKKRLLFT